MRFGVLLGTTVLHIRLWDIIYIYMYIYIDTHINKYIHVNTQIYIYIHTYMHKPPTKSK